MTEEDLAPEHRLLFADIYSEFVSDSEIEALPRLLAERVSPIRRSELLWVLWMLHFRALHLLCTRIPFVNELWGKNGFPLRDSQRSPRFGEYLAAFDQMTSEHLDGEIRIEKLCKDLISAIYQGNLNYDYSGLSQKHGAPWRAVISDFPDDYVNALEKLLFYDTYTASFVGDPTQASMWSVYGDQHRGCCLKFKVKPGPAGSPSLNLRHFKGESSSPSETRLNFEYGLLPLQKVEYKAQLPEVDFFRNMGATTPGQRTFWCLRSDGTYDQDAAKPFIADENSRTEYWDAFDAITTTKLRDWQHEAEYRITWHSTIRNVSDPSFRKMQYEFEDLEGVIFGIKTLQPKKLEIMRVLERKCRERERWDLKLYQAYYSRHSGRIEVDSLDLLRWAH